MNNKEILKNRTVVFLLAMFCCLLWGSAFPCIKLGCDLSHIAPDDIFSQIFYAGLRFILAGALALLIGRFIFHKRLIINNNSLRKSCRLSFFQTILQYTFFYIGLSRSTGMKSSVITASNVFLSIIVASIVFRTEKLTFRKICGCFVGFLGIFLMNLSGMSCGFRLTGEGFVFLSALSYAFSSALIKRYSCEEDPFLLSGLQFIIGGTFMTIFSFVLGGRMNVINTRGVIMLIYLAFVSAIAFSVWGTLIKYNNVSTVAVYGFMNPIFGVILSYLILSEKSRSGLWGMVAALVLVTAGIIIVNLPAKKMYSKS